MNELILIREYDKKDKSTVLNLLKLNTPEYFSPEEETDLDNYLENERELYFVLQIGANAVGCGGINFADNSTIGKISWDIIHPDFQGQLLGTQLLLHRIEKLNSIDSIQKIVVRTSQFAYKFYEKHGFVLLEIINDYWAKGLNMYYMEYKHKRNNSNH